MSDVDALAMPAKRHRMFIRYQNHYIKQIERSR